MIAFLKSSNQRTRQVRSRSNLVFFLLELPYNTNTDDMQSILEVFCQIDTDVRTVNLLRLGKVSNQCQPIRITLPNKHDVFNLLKIKNKLRQSENYKHVIFFTNCTLLQRKHFKLILDVINIKKSAGKNDLY